MRKYILAACAFASLLTFGARRETTLKKGWEFAKGGEGELEWKSVRMPHDWAVYGPFDRNNDLQVVAIEQNGEKEETVKTGRTGGLPYEGKGEYRTHFTVDSTNGKSFTLLFDGAMSNARVKVNGKDVGGWAFGYNSFFLNIDGAVKQGDNLLEVSLENYPESSRWYPGAGLYRNVHLVATDKVHVPVWGTYITTPVVGEDYASINIKTMVEGLVKGEKVVIRTEVKDASGNVKVATSSTHTAFPGQPETQNLLLESPRLWSPETPYLYTATTSIIKDEKVVDTYDTRFGVRKLEYVPEKGFFLNGKLTKFRGVCNHHDLGPLGAAVNKSALRYQLELLKNMGCNAIRTSHNMPAPELVELCDEMGFMMMIEPFDDWGFRPKCKNGYGSIFNEWAERDMVNMLHHYRNNPSVVMWSIGNEVPSQWGPDGIGELAMLRDICHREDPTRPITCGMDQINAVLHNGFASALDIPGFNYKVGRYKEAYSILPQHLILGSETASTVSSRGNYKFPPELKANATYEDHQSSSYDTEFCSWSNIPDLDFAADEDLPYVIGQFVWTGFDYLGEPTPYDTDAWPNHSSMFGIIDLASIPKDRYYLYRSVWNKEDATLHILPHWNWKGREGQVTPVFVYTSYPKAELFINGKSQGIREKNDSTVMNRYRLMWNETKYTPGELKVVAYGANGKPVEEKVVKTAGAPHHLVLTANRTTLAADGEDLVYITARVADKDGNIVPTDTRLVNFKVVGAGEFVATANGDPTCLLPFHKPEMNLFSGALTVIARSAAEKGRLTLTASAKGVKSAKIEISVE